MNLKHFIFNPFGVNGFVLSNQDHEAILIDPSVGSDTEKFTLKTYIEKNDLKVKFLLNTHLHLDHVLGNAFVERTFGVKAFAHQEDEFLLDLQEEQSQMYGLDFKEAAGPLGGIIAEGDVVGVKGLQLQVIHVAGHSPGGVAFYCSNPGEIFVEGEYIKNAPPLLFSGDILFAGSRGRSDLFGGDDFALVNGIKNKLLTLPKNTLVLPGHGNFTTIENELQNFRF